jgi:hypothetical protein
MRCLRAPACLLAGLSFLALSPRAQDDPALRARLERLEAQNESLERRVAALGHEIEARSAGELMPPAGEGRFGLGPAASKIYGLDHGVSIAGYGEFLYEQRSGRTDRFDALRAVLYAGYRFDPRFVFNSEIEFEHGTTSATSGTTSEGGSVSVEFATLDWLRDDALNLRGGLVLVPMGLLNELHEPTTFLAANRPQTERRILPTTWRELGVGAFGEVDGFAYRAYLLTALDGEEFGAAGLRGGRQNGNRAAADDFAGVVRVDWTGTGGVLAGGSVYWGDTGQDGRDAAGNPIPDLETLILEAHADVRSGPFSLRALYAAALIDDARAFNMSAGRNLARTLQGWYLELGCDLLAALAPDSRHSLTPFLRYERIDTQASMPAGFAADPAQDEDVYTFGVNYKPIPQIVLKADFDAFEKSGDQLNVLLGYVF